MHPGGPLRRTHLYNMVLIFLFTILAAIVVAISMIYSSFGSLAGSGIAKENVSIVREGAEKSPVADQTTKFLIVVLPDGKIVNPVVADRF
jgi:hypothetical protein